MRHGISASRVWLPKRNSPHAKDITRDINNSEGNWNTILEFLVDRFPYISEEILKERMSRGDIVDQNGRAFIKESPYQEELFLFYYREIHNEPAIPFKEKIIFKDDDIIVVDKPHFIPVTPTGRFVKESLLARLKHHYQNEDISPIHRLDRETAGIVMFTCNPEVRGAYQVLFQQRLVKKVYHAIAAKTDLKFPVTHKSKMGKSDHFFIMEEQEGETNSETTIDVEEVKGNVEKGNLAKYILKPLTGKQHQLRVHMMSLGIPILNDPFYPELLPCKGEDYSQPLQLLAKSIAFIDPITDEERYYESEKNLVL